MDYDHNIKWFFLREEQVLILRNAIAVIQTSLFEGWSIVVEDAKAQNKFVISSSFKVHKNNSSLMFFLNQ